MIVAIIPARSGSVRIKNKNIKNFLKKPMISYAINGAKKSKLFDKIVVSTDSNHIGLISNVSNNEKDEKIFHMIHASSSSGIQDTEKTNYTKTGVNKNSYWSPKISGYGRVV